MKTTRKIIDVMAGRLRKNESVSVVDMRIEAHGGIEQYAEYLLKDDIAKAEAQARKLLRKTQQETPMIQLAIPGMDYATLPMAMAVHDEDLGETIVKPLLMCTLSEVKSEVAAMRRNVNTQDRVVGAYEATVARLIELGYDTNKMMGDIQDELRSISEVQA